VLDLRPAALDLLAAAVRVRIVVKRV